MRRINQFAGLALLLVMEAATGEARGDDGAATVHSPDQVDFSMLFMADVRDSPECHVAVIDGQILFGAGIANPAMTCPDAFAWKLMADSVAAGFWENWSTNRQVWPSDPWPRCTPGDTTGKCCPEVAASNDAWPEHCPVFPGASEGAPGHGLAEPGVAARVSLAQAAPEDANGDGRVDWADVPAALRTPVIGSVQGELVYRNRPMVDYIFDRGLYATDGLTGVFTNILRTTETYAPYWPEPDNPAAGHDAPPLSAAIVFPVRSVMIKADWIALEDAPKIGIDPNDPDHPFVTMDLVPINQSNKRPDGTPATKPHILVSFHISSKDVPNWFWSTFEHAANQGRCDWIGCNDSFGYVVTSVPVLDANAAQGLAPPARNFIPPHEMPSIDGFKQSAFVLGERYLGVDTISDGLAAIFAAYGIGTAEGVNRSGRPTAADVAWRSYRLKGSQTGFVTPTGRPVRLGNSVTEAGFVNTASCMSCHARAGATEAGTPPLGIFTDTIDEIGMPQSVNGLPVEAWFNVNAYRNVKGTREAPGVIAVQTDFVWGFRNACPMKPVPFGPSWCKNVMPPAK